ncbi:MAG TPA: ABC transporter substrate-binding protein, partial [Candidatus Binataceae bacterium]
MKTRGVGRVLGFCVVSLVPIATVLGCHIRRPATSHAEQQVLYSSTISDPKTFNPVLVTDQGSAEVTGNLFEGLIRTNPKTMLPEPDLAESWDFSDGAKVITFHLRHGVKWYDGESFTARDVLFTLRVIYDPRVPNSEQPILTVAGKPIEARALDDYTVQMKLVRPFAPLLYSIGFEILPAHVLEPALDNGSFNRTWGIDTPPEKIVGLGPFRFTRYVPAQSIQFKRNQDYWMRDDKGGQLPRLSGQTSLIVQDQNAAYLRFLSGQTDIHSAQPKEVLDLRTKADQLKIRLAETGVDTGSLFFSFNRNPRHFVRDGRTDPKFVWFTDLNFVRAIAHLIDKRSMIDLCLDGLGDPAVANISPANKIFHNPDLKDYDYDPKEAEQILESAGYHLIRPGVRADSKGNPIVFNLTTNAGNPIREQMCAIFKQDLANLGIRADYRPLEFTTLVEKLDSSFAWDCILMGFTGGIEPNNGANFLRSSGNLHIWNPSQPSPATPWEAEIDQLLDAGGAEMDLKKRPAYYWRIQEILHDQLPILETIRQK